MQFWWAVYELRGYTTQKTIIFIVHNREAFLDQLSALPENLLEYGAV
jgi:hypothetical protein